MDANPRCRVVLLMVLFDPSFASLITMANWAFNFPAVTKPSLARRLIATVAKEFRRAQKMIGELSAAAQSHPRVKFKSFEEPSLS